MKELGKPRQHSAKPNLNATRNKSRQAGSGAPPAHGNTQGKTAADNSSGSVIATSDNQEWIQQKRTSRRALDKKAEPALNMNNKFAPLADGENNGGESSSAAHAEPNDSVPDSDKAEKPKTERPPAIYCWHNSTKALIQDLVINGVKSDQFTVKEVIKGKSINNQSIFTKSLEALTQVKSALDALKLQHFSHTPKSQKSKLLVLKGLNSEYTPDEIKSELVNLNLPDVTIKKIDHIKFSGKDSAPSHLLVQLTPDSKIANITKTKYLVSQVIRW